ncbi:unnamed protein product [Owenia fusiformis]|uniref:Uncharacterized protein n=1 Tax=Owenia fusiformis TaxID=6347 RepID=A0A8S4PDE5_OWEFU|nr:unnamed protein product [Owenia fusiformis]
MAGNLQRNTLIKLGELQENKQQNWVHLKEPVDLTSSENKPEHIKQRTPEWFDLRQRYRLTGSTLYNALGLRTLKAQQEHFDSVVKGKKKPDFTDETKSYLEYGTANEPNLVATLTGKILPAFYPNYVFVEEGAREIKRKDKSTMLISGDGALVNKNEFDSAMESSRAPKMEIAIEGKCRFPKDYKLPVHYGLELGHVPQVLSEMVALDVRKLLYLSYSHQSTTCFIVTYDDDLWEMLSREASLIYGSDNPQRPTRLTASSKLLKEALKMFVSTNVEFVCEVASNSILRGSDSLKSLCSPFKGCPFLVTKRDNADHVLAIPLENDVIERASKILQEAYELLRKKATEVLVWLISTTDREWSPECPHAIPIAWALKGYSLSNDVMRKMTDTILNKLERSEIKISCTVFDGQWAKYASRSKEAEPLNILQLQKDVWTEVRGMKKELLMEKFGTLKITDCNVLRSDTGFDVTSKSYAKLRTQLYHTFIASQDETSADDDKTAESNDTVNTTIDANVVSSLPDGALDVLLTETNSPEFLDGLDEIAVGEEKEIDGETEVDGATVFGDVQLISQEITLIGCLEALQADKKESVSIKWKNRKYEDIKTKLSNAREMSSLTVHEIDIVINELIIKQKISPTSIRKSWPKHDKVNRLSSLIGDGSEINPPERRVKTMKSLREFSIQAIIKPRSNIKQFKLPTRTHLNVAYATLSYPYRYKCWKETMKTVDVNKIYGLDSSSPYEWFYFPEYSKERNRIEPRCLDGDHIFVNTRVKVCKDGLEGVSKAAWHAVSSARPDLLSKSLVEDLIDKQNNRFAKTTFSEAVERCMIDLQYKEEAQFTRLIRRWYEAEDDPGIPAVERAKRRYEFREYLMDGVDFGSFPPPGQYIKGMPIITYEGILQSIDCHMLLYSLCRNGTYNQRAISSLVNENFFGELSEIEPTKLGCPKATTVGRLMATVTELLHYRHNPLCRTFQMSTAKRPVYPQHKLDEQAPSNPEENFVPDEIKFNASTNKMEISAIHLRDHYFDSVKRAARKQRKGKAGDVSNPRAPSRGALPVRQYHRVDESKILPTQRLGIQLE